MGETASVLIINVHGGFPSSMIQKAFQQLPNLRDLSAHSDLHTRAYVTNIVEEASLHDLIMDAPLGSMIDNVWHEWGQVRRPSRTLFHIFQQQGFRTELFGAFGLDRRLDPHTNMCNFPNSCQKRLQYFGIDTFESQDAAFACGLAVERDEDVFRSACSFLESINPALPSMCMINLLGCKDVHKLRFSTVTTENSRVPSVPVDVISERSHSVGLTGVVCVDPKLHSANVADNPRSEMSASAGVVALKRTAMLYDWLRDERPHEKSGTHGVRVASEMSRFSWESLLQLDKCIGQLLTTLKTSGRITTTRIYVTSDHPISLFQHGQVDHTPWDACLRSFLLVHQPGQVGGRILDHPYTLAHLPTRIMNDCGIYADWHVHASSTSALTVGLAPSSLCSAFIEPPIDVFEFSAFFMRLATCRAGRIYSMIAWFCIKDLFEASNVEFETLSRAERAHVCAATRAWENPVMKSHLSKQIVQVYDLTIDPSEEHNLVNPEWIEGNAASALYAELCAAIIQCGYNSLQMNFPPNVHEMTPDHITFSHLQNPQQHKSQRPLPRVRSIATQTEGGLEVREVQSPQATSRTVSTRSAQAVVQSSRSIVIEPAVTTATVSPPPPPTTRLSPLSTPTHVASKMPDEGHPRLFVHANKGDFQHLKPKGGRGSAKNAELWRFKKESRR